MVKRGVLRARSVIRKGLVIGFQRPRSRIHLIGRPGLAAYRGLGSNVIHVAHARTRAPRPGGGQGESDADENGDDDRGSVAVGGRTGRRRAGGGAPWGRGDPAPPST